MRTKYSTRQRDEVTNIKFHRLERQPESSVRMFTREHYSFLSPYWV